MKVRVLIGALLICSSAIYARDADHLEPPPLARYEVYWEILMSKLSITAYNCGRSVILPFGQPEASHSVYSMKIDGRQVYYVTRISLDKDLWDLTDGGQHPEKGALVKTHRTDVEMPEATADLLRQVWLQMLGGSNKPEPTPTPDHAILMDPSFLVFSIDAATGPPLVGALNLSAKHPGVKTKHLVELSELIYEYCGAGEAKRPAIEKKIHDKAQRLLSLLRR